MSNPKHPPAGPSSDPVEPDSYAPRPNELTPDELDAEAGPSQGPSLTLLYSLIALALAAAIGFAMMIVLPFYRRR
jgi:hypothetical protein